MIVRSPGIVTLVSQDLKVFSFCKAEKKTICLKPQLSSLLVHALRVLVHARDAGSRINWLVDARLAAEKTHHLKFRTSCPAEEYYVKAVGRSHGLQLLLRKVVQIGALLDTLPWLVLLIIKDIAAATLTTGDRPGIAV